MNILGIIPARSGSKGIPRKNIKLLGGKPLIQYTIESAQNAQNITDLVVSTDDIEIADVSKTLNAIVPGLRPAKLATDKSPSIDTVLYTLKLMMQRGYSYDAVCLLQPTTPFRSKRIIDYAIEKFIRKGADSLVSVLPVPHEYNPHWVFEASNEDLLSISTGDKELIPRRQELPQTFFRDGSIYLTDTNVLLQQKSLYGNRLAYIQSDNNNYVNLDTMKDWEKAVEIVRNKNS